MLARVLKENIEIGLPISGNLLDGRGVSGYNLLPLSELKAEKWKDAIENKPIYDENTEFLIIDTFQELEESIIINYKAERFED